MNHSGLRTSLDYLNWLRKDVFAMIQQLGPPTFFVFISAENIWLLLLKCLYDLNSKNLKLNILFDKLEPKHVVNHIRCDPITCARYYDYCMRSFHTLCNSIFGHALDFFFVAKCCHGDVLIANHCTMGCTCLQTTYISWFPCTNLFSQY
jgi:hypothetical protein